MSKREMTHSELKLAYREKVNYVYELVNGYNEQLMVKHKELKGAKNKSERYREALKFYADESIYNFETETDFDVGETRIIKEGHIFRDFGKKARKTLEE